MQRFAESRLESVMTWEKSCFLNRWDYHQRKTTECADDGFKRKVRGIFLLNIHLVQSFVSLQWVDFAPSTSTRRVTQCSSDDGGRWWIAQCAREGWFEPHVKRQVERAARLNGLSAWERIPFKGNGLTLTWSCRLRESIRWVLVSDHAHSAFKMRRRRPKQKENEIV